MARPLTTRYLQALSWDYFSFHTRWKTLPHSLSWCDPFPGAVKSSLHNILIGEPLVSLGSAPDVLLRQPGPSNQAGPDEIPLLDLFIHAGLWLLHVVFLNPPGNAPQPPPLLHESFQYDLLLRRMTWSLSCLSQRRSWKKSMIVEWKAHRWIYVPSTLYFWDLVLALNNSLYKVWRRAGERDARPNFSAFVKDDEGENSLSLFPLPSNKYESSCINCNWYKGAGEEEDHRAWLFPWPLIYSCCVLLLQGLLDCSVTLVKFKRGYLVDFFFQFHFYPPIRQHLASSIPWRGAWFSSTSRQYLSNTKMFNRSTLPGTRTVY